MRERRIGFFWFLGRVVLWVVGGLREGGEVLRAEGGMWEGWEKDDMIEGWRGWEIFVDGFGDRRVRRWRPLLELEGL